MENTNKNNKFILFLKEFVPYIVAIILVIVLKKYLYTPIKVNGESMMKTLYDGDIMILDIIGYKKDGLKRFDIVVVDEGNELIIKRVIGLPGESVEYKNNKLYINGRVVKDKYPSNKTDDFSIEVPKGEYFVLGDNRGNSMDSRVFGTFSKSDILGKTNLIIFPFNRLGIKK